MMIEFLNPERLAQPDASNSCAIDLEVIKKDGSPGE